jgi:KDO2-lipid IV(A) lauroyltransferase
VINRQGKTGYHQIRVSPAFDLETPYNDQDRNIRHNTERLNRIIEQWIREAPDQWWWVHKRWKVQDNPEGWDIPEESPSTNQSN